MSTRTVHFKATVPDLLALFQQGNIDIDPGHAVVTGPNIHTVAMVGASSVPTEGGHRLSLQEGSNLTRIDFWIKGNLVRSAVTGTDPQGEPIVTSMSRGPHITMRLRGAHSETFVDRVISAYSGEPDEDHDSPQALLSFFNVTARTVRTRAGVTLISMTPNDDSPEHETLTPLVYPSHRFA